MCSSKPLVGINQFQIGQIASAPSIRPEVTNLTVFGKTVVINIVTTTTISGVTIFDNVALRQLDRTTLLVTPPRNPITKISTRLNNPIPLTRCKIFMSHNVLLVVA
jgi:hypothetical protein